MSNSPNNREQDQLFPATPSQINPGRAVPSDFKINTDRGPGQCGDTKKEQAALLAEGDADGKSKLGEPTPERNEVPHRRMTDKVGGHE